MKTHRAEDNVQHPRKRQRTLTNPDLFDFPEHQQDLMSVLQGEVKGYVVGTVSSVLSREVVVDVEDGGTVKIIFGQVCATKIRAYKFRLSPQDRLFLSLQGCTAIESGKPMAMLTFAESVLLKVVRKVGTITVVDHWGGTRCIPLQKLICSSFTEEGFRPWTRVEPEFETSWNEQDSLDIHAGCRCENVCIFLMYSCYPAYRFVCSFSSPRWHMSTRMVVTPLLLSHLPIQKSPRLALEVRAGLSTYEMVAKCE
jgi:hypothetical protein